MTEVHICRGTGKCYHARVRRPFSRKWDWVGPKRKRLDKAIKDLGEMFSPNVYIAGDVILCADWYDPLPVLKIKRQI